MSRLIDADALMDYCNNQKDKTIDANDIARFPIVGGWISVKDRLPEGGFLGKLICDNEGQVSVCGSYCTYHVATGEKVFLPGHSFLDLLLQGEKKCEDAWNFTHITHWMELPEPPKEEN